MITVPEFLRRDELKRLIKIPSTWGAKITGAQFKDRAADFLRRKR